MSDYRLNKLFAIQCFVAVINQGGFAAAARQLNVSKGTVTKSILRLEAEMGVLLISRNSRAYSLTDAGQPFYVSSRRILEDLERAENAASRGADNPTGCIRIAMPIAYTRHVLPSIRDFLRKYPSIQMDHDARDDAVDIVKEGFDLWVTTRVHSMDSTGLTARTIVRSPLGVFASKSYLAEFGTPETPDDLMKHNCIQSPALGSRWPFTASDGNTRILTVPGNFAVSSGEIMREAVAAGIGLTFSNFRLFSWDIAQGNVVPVLQDYVAGTSQLSIIYPANPYLPKRTRLLIDYLNDLEKKEPWIHVED
jgi:DNA-binding transcriptional LysR family regulator